MFIWGSRCQLVDQIYVAVFHLGSQLLLRVLHLKGSVWDAAEQFVDQFHIPFVLQGSLTEATEQRVDQFHMNLVPFGQAAIAQYSAYRGACVEAGRPCFS